MKSSSIRGNGGPERWDVAEVFKQSTKEVGEIVAFRGVERADAVGLSFEKSRERVLSKLGTVGAEPYQDAATVVGVRVAFNEPCFLEAVEAGRHSSRCNQHSVCEPGGC